MQVLADCSQISFTDAIPACNATGEAEVAAAQASITEGVCARACVPNLLHMPGARHQRLLWQVHFRLLVSSCHTGLALRGAAKVLPGAAMSGLCWLLCSHQLTRSSSADLSSGGRALFFVQTSGIGTDAICTAQGAFFDAALGPAKSIKAFFADLSKLCISVGLGTCPQYNAELTAYGAAGMAECVTSDLQPSYAAYLLGEFNAIAQLYSAGALTCYLGQALCPSTFAFASECWYQSLYRSRI